MNISIEGEDFELPQLEETVLMVNGKAQSYLI